MTRVASHFRLDEKCSVEAFRLTTQHFIQKILVARVGSPGSPQRQRGHSQQAPLGADTLVSIKLHRLPNQFRSGAIRQSRVLLKLSINRFGDIDGDGFHTWIVMYPIGERKYQWWGLWL